MHIVESAELAWEPAVTKCTDMKNVERDVSMFGCFPWTSESYPWPTYFDKNNKKVYAAPGMQIDLEAVFVKVVVRFIHAAFNKTSSSARISLEDLAILL